MVDLATAFYFTVSVVFAGIGGAVLANPFLKALVLQSLTGKPRFVCVLGGAKPNLAFGISKFPIGTNPISVKIGGQEIALAPNPGLHKTAWNVNCGLFDPADGRQVPFEALSYFWEFEATKDGKVVPLTKEVKVTFDDGRKGKAVIEAPRYANNLKILGKMYDPFQMGALQNKYFSWEKNKALKDLQKNPIYTWLPWVTAVLALTAVFVSLYNASLTAGTMNQISQIPSAINATVGVARLG